MKLATFYGLKEETNKVEIDRILFNEIDQRR